MEFGQSHGNGNITRRAEETPKATLRIVVFWPESPSSCVLYIASITLMDLQPFLVLLLLPFCFIMCLGRKNTIIATAIPFMVAGLLVTFAQGVYMIYAGRAITGFCIGIVSLSLPVYLAEAIHPEVRGVLGLLPTTLGTYILVIGRE